MKWKNRHFWVKVGIRLYGAVLILWSLAVLMILTEGAFSYYEVWRSAPPLQLVGVLASILELSGSSDVGQVIGIGIIGAPISVGFLGLTASLAYLFTGFGALRFRPWTIRMAMVLATDVLASHCFSLWLYGSQNFGLLSYLGIALLLAVHVSFFADRGIRKELSVGRASPGRGPKALLALYVGVLALKVISAPLFIGYLHIAQGDMVRALNTKPRKVRYEIVDPDYIKEQCTRHDIFSYSIHLPNDLTVLFVSRGPEGSSWFLWLTKRDLVSTKVVDHFNLADRSEIENFAGLSSLLRFDSFYEFDKRLSYPTWSPLHLSFKAMQGPFEEVEDVTGSTWKGFVKITQQTVHDSLRRDIYRCTAYGLTGNSSVSIHASITGGWITSYRMRDILASLEFKTEPENATESYTRGILALSDERYLDATISFLNALYIDDRNPQYAYYLAKSLFEDPSQPRRKGRLFASKDFLEYALALDSMYEEAKELLPIVEEEYEAMKERESE